MADFERSAANSRAEVPAVSQTSPNCGYAIEPDGKNTRPKEPPMTEKKSDATQEAANAYAPSSQDANGQPQNPPKEDQKGEQKKQPSQQY